MIRCWMRVLTIKLRSKISKRLLIFGENYKRGLDDLNISVQGSKFMAPMKDLFQITITNLTYNEIVQLINGQYYECTIDAGYRSSNIYTLFKGEVLNISNNLGDRKSNDVIITVASKFMARMGQTKLNLTLNSGINLYSAISYVSKYSGNPNFKISPDLKNRLLKERESISKISGSWLETLSNIKGLGISSDSSLGNSNLNIIDLYKNNNRVVNLNSSNIILTGGYPRLDSNGLKLSIMPSFNFMPTDTIVIDNSIIDIGTTGYGIEDLTVGNWVDKDGKYMIYQIDYDLNNRSGNFTATLSCKSRSLYSNTLGLIKGRL